MLIRISDSYGIMLISYHKKYKLNFNLFCFFKLILTNIYIYTQIFFTFC